VGNGSGNGNGDYGHVHCIVDIRFEQIDRDIDRDIDFAASSIT
jgi:hypothetical protein